MKHFSFKTIALLFLITLLNLVPFSSLSASAAAGDPSGSPAATGTPAPSESASPSPSPSAAVPVTGISFGDSETKPFQLDPQEKKDLTVFIVPLEASDTTTVTWSSSDTNVATVTASTTNSHTATVLAVGPGSATITAATQDGKHTASRGVTVSGIAFSPNTVDLFVGGSTTLVPVKYGSATTDTTVTWEWKGDSSSNAARVNSSGQVTGISEGSAVITCVSTNGKYSASCTVRVTRNESGTITASLTNGTLHFDTIEDRIDRNCRDLLGTSLSYITGLTVPTDQGTLYYGYVSDSDPGAGVATSRQYYYGSSGEYQIGKVIFAPKPGYSGTAEISYNGFTAGGNSCQGKIRVTVDNSKEMMYLSENSAVVHFQADDFSNYSETVNGRAIKYVIFTLPSADYGKLYYNYTGTSVNGTEVTENTQYYRNTSPSIDNISFVPAEDYSGTFTLRYLGCDTANATFRGTIRIKVTRPSASSSSEDGDLTYYTDPGRRVYFEPNDFNDACYNETDEKLSYVRFTLPSSSRGTLYYNGSTKVSSGTSYYYTSGSRSLADVSFLPEDDFKGTVNIRFRGWSVDGENFSGTVTVYVGVDRDDDDVRGDITYTVKSGKRVTFQTSDFSNFSYDKTGRQLNRVRFSLPLSSRGILYYNGNKRVSAGTYYYRTGSSNRLLEDVSFVANANYTGTVKIHFTGYDTRGESFDGVVAIGVSTNDNINSSGLIQSSQLVSYTSMGAPVGFWASDFTTACGSALSDVLASVHFNTIPDAYTGILCLDYVSPIEYKAFNTTQDYSLGGLPSLSQIVFVPKAGYRGTVQIPFTAKDIKGKTCTGVVRIYVTPSTTSAYFNDLGNYSWAVPSIDFLYQSGIVKGISADCYDPSSYMRRGDFVLMLSRAFQLHPAGSVSYNDVSPNLYYAEAIASARSLGIVTGDENGRFWPDSPISRQSAAVILYRCLKLHSAVPTGNTNSLANFADRADVLPYAEEALGALVRLGIMTGDENGNLSPTAALDRAQMAVILHRALT